MKRLLSICLIVCLLVMAIPVVSVAATQYGVVHGGWLRLRAAASFDAATISSYNTGTTVTILNTSGSWYYVQAPDGNKGYMYSSYLTVSDSSGGGSAVGNATVWSSNGYGVRMRSGPGKGYRIIKVYSVGTVVEVLERGAYWSRIRVGNLTGYMMNEFLTGGGAPAPSPSGNATIWSANGYGVRLRTGPGKGYSVIGVYSVGTRVTILERGAVWDKIMVGSRVGYMMNEFLRYYSNMQVTNVTLNNTTPVVGNVLAVKTLTPADAKVSYSWLVNGIEQGTAATYTVMDADVNKTIQLKVTGIDGYTGSATSETTSAVVTATTVTAVALNLGAGEAPLVGNVLQVASITPANATVSYVWNVGGVQKSTASTYTVQSVDAGKRIELIVKGTGVYSGTVSSGETLPVASTAPVTGVTIYLGASALTGAPNVGDTLTAVVAPSNATVQYTWTVYNADGTAYRTGNQKDFAITINDAGKTIKVTVTGIAPYYSSSTSSETAVVNATTAAPTITGGDTSMTLPVGYAATSTAAYTITGNPTPTVTKTAGDAKITWNNTTKKLDIATGLTAGTYPVTLTASNGVTPNATFTFTLTVSAATAAPTITTTTLTNGVVGTAYSATLAATGTTPITWSLDSGNLPDGLTLNSNTGAISGTPTTDGTFNFTMKASNGVSPDDTKALSIVVDPATPLATAPTITTTTLTSGKVGDPYSATLAATGDTPITWTLASGNLPGGLTLNGATGEISGTPTTDGTFNFAMKASNGVSPDDTKALSIVIDPATPPAPEEKDSLVVSAIDDSVTGELSVTVSNPNGVVVTYAWSSSATTHTSSSLIYTLDSGDGAGTVITFTVTCGGDGSSVTRTHTL